MVPLSAKEGRDFSGLHPLTVFKGAEEGTILEEGVVVVIVELGFFVTGLIK